MRAPFVLVALLTVLSACAMPQHSAHAPGRGYQPLRAYISGPDFGGLGFQVNRPAHVALFEVAPGRGTSMVYPSAGYGSMSGYVTTGRSHLGRQRIAARDLYLPAHRVSAQQGPTFYFLIASERPLNLKRFGGYGMGIQNVLGGSFSAYSAYNTMERLAEVALPSMVEDGSWTTDVYVHWPQAISTVPDSRHVLLTCNGYEVYVRLEYLVQARQALCTRPDESPTAPDSASAPEGEVVPRLRRPEASAGGLSDQVRSSTQLQEGGETRQRRTPDRSAPGADRQGQSGAESGSARTRRSVTRPAAGSGREASGGRTSRPAPAARPTTERRPEAQKPAPRAPERREPRPAPTPERCADC